MRALRYLAGLVVVLAIIWVGLWWYAEGRMESGFTDWADQLATQGWKISYGTLKRGTSPTEAALELTDLVLNPPADATGKTVTVTLPSLVLRIDAFDPLRLHTDFPNKINVDVGSQIDVVVSFTNVASTQTLDPHVLFSHGGYPYRSGDFVASGVDILASQGSLLVLHMDRLVGHFTLNPGAGAQGLALASTEAVDGIAVSPLMTHLLGIPFGGRISHVALGLNLSGPVPAGITGLMAQLRAAQGDEVAQQKIIMPVVHEWARQGGNGNANLSLVLGPTTASASAALKFDAAQQPAVTADATANHLDTLFAAITDAYPQVQDDVAQLEAQLSPYLTSSDTGGQTLALHIAYGSGSLSVNGQKGPALPPVVDWNALENPPPAPAVAPGDGSGATP